MQEPIDAATLARQIAAGAPLLFLRTANEARSEELIARCMRQGLPSLPEPVTWTCTRGFPEVAETKEPLAALNWALAQTGRRVFVFKDMHWFWHDQPYLQRLLLEAAEQPGDAPKTFIFLGHEANLPGALEKSFLLFEHALPDRAELRSFFQERRDKDPLLQKIVQSSEDIDRLVLATQGLDLSELRHAMRLTRLQREAQLDQLVASLFRTKKQILQKTGIMEFVDNDTAAAQVGGMENLKEWLAKRERAFGADDLAAGRNLPKGVLIMGISGCGKSLFVKAIAARWRLPLVRLDMATVYEGTYGSPESSLRQALRTAESLAPCVLWIDEIEAGISNQGFKAEGGAASRVLGYFLTWMQEKRAAVFVAATANAIEMLPAEILRKGRFDEIFYVSLPEVPEREAIFRIHLQRRGFAADNFSLSMLAHSAKGFSGAEIEQAVASAVFECLAQNRPLTQQDVMEAIGRTVPLSITMAEQIKKIEAWAFKRAVSASKTGNR